VPIEYEIELYGAVKKVTLPFVVGVIADLSGQPAEPLLPLEDRKLLEFDRENLDLRMRATRPRVAFSLAHPIGDAGGPQDIELVFESMDDFAPEAIVRRVPWLAAMLDERLTLAELRDLFHAKPRLADEVLGALREGGAWPLPDPQAPPEESSAAALAAPLREQLGVLSLGTGFGMHVLSRRFETERWPNAAGLTAATAQALKPLDEQLGAWVDAILHHPRLQRLEAAWRGIEFLVRRGFTDRTTICRVMNARTDELLADFRRAPRYDHSTLFRKLQEELLMLGGSPYAMVVVDHGFSFEPRDVELLEELARVGLALDLVFCAGVSAAMFQMETFLELSAPRDLTKMFAVPEYAQWRYLRDMEASRHLALAMPRVIGREPHRLDDADGGAFNFVESADNHAQRLWINPAFALVDCTRAAFVRHGWYGALRGVDGGGLVDGLPCHASHAPDGELELYCPTETPISGRREEELVSCGFVPLLHCKGTDYAVFFSTPTVCKPQSFDDPDFEARDAALCDLRSVLAFGLLMRYLIAIYRDSRDRETILARLRVFLDGLASANPTDPGSAPLLKQYSIDIEWHSDLANDFSIKAGFELGFQFEDAMVTYFPTVRLDTVLGSA